MKKIIVFVQVLIFIGLLAGCQQKASESAVIDSDEVSPSSEVSAEPSPIVNVEKTALTKIELDQFKQRYTQAVSDVQAGKTSGELAPNDHAETGFAIIPIDESAGFAVLPLGVREMTDDELLQLAVGMDGLSADELLTQNHSWYKDCGYNTTREYTWGEYQRKGLIELLYLYENLRPLASEENDLASFKVSDSETFWILGSENLSDQQLLKIIDEQRSEIAHAAQPPAEHMTYQAVKELCAKAPIEYGFNERQPDEVYAYYTPNSGGAWGGILIYDNKENYQIKINPVDGTLISWERYTDGYYKGDTKPEVPKSSDAVYSDDEVYSIAEKYAKDYFKVTEISSKNIQKKDSHLNGNGWKVALQVPNQEFTLFITETNGMLEVFSLYII